MLLFIILNLTGPEALARLPARPTACVMTIVSNAQTGPVTSLSCDGQPTIRLPRKSWNIQEEQSGQLAAVLAMTRIKLNGCQTVTTMKDTFVKFVCVFSADLMGQL